MAGRVTPRRTWLGVGLPWQHHLIGNLSNDSVSVTQMELTTAAGQSACRPSLRVTAVSAACEAFQGDQLVAVQSVTVPG